jgi:hypothetical protein
MESETERILAEGRKIAGETNWNAVLRLKSHSDPDAAVRRAHKISERLLVKLAKEAELPRLADRLQSLYLRRKSKGGLDLLDQLQVELSKSPDDKLDKFVSQVDKVTLAFAIVHLDERQGAIRHALKTPPFSLMQVLSDAGKEHIWIRKKVFDHD